MNKNLKVAKGAWLTILIFAFMMLSGIGILVTAGDTPQEGEEPDASITTDKHTYIQGEPVQITINGYRQGSSTTINRGYVIKDEFGRWVRDPPQLITCDVAMSIGPDYYTWDQKYDIINEYDLLGNPIIHYLKNGEQVSLGKYYIYGIPGDIGPVEIEIVEKNSEPVPINNPVKDPIQTLPPDPIHIVEPETDPELSPPVDSIQPTSQAIDGNQQDIQTMDTTKDSNLALQTIAVIMIVFFISMLLTFMEVKAAAHLLEIKLY
jgi:hypothetical protein